MNSSYLSTKRIIREISLETNFAGQEVTDKEQLEAFIGKVKFPSHALIMRKAKNDTLNLIKGITSREILYNHFHQFQSNYGSAFVETDTRAMYNPTRMSVIQKTTEKLVSTIKSRCPGYNALYFSVGESKPGLHMQHVSFSNPIDTKLHISM